MYVQGKSIHLAITHPHQHHHSYPDTSSWSQLKDELYSKNTKEENAINPKPDTRATFTSISSRAEILQKVMYPGPGVCNEFQVSPRILVGWQRGFFASCSAHQLRFPLSQHFCFSSPTVSWLQELNHRKSIHFLL